MAALPGGDGEADGSRVGVAEVGDGLEADADEDGVGDAVADADADADQTDMDDDASEIEGPTDDDE